MISREGRNGDGGETGGGEVGGGGEGGEVGGGDGGEEVGEGGGGGDDSGRYHSGKVRNERDSTVPGSPEGERG